MKITHLSLIFLVIFFVGLTILDLKISRYESNAERKNRVDQNFMQAVTSATQYLVSTGEVHNIDKEASVEAFFTSLYASFGLIDDTIKQELLQAYIPILGISCDDGFYICYSKQIIDQQGTKKMVKQWSEKVQFVVEDEFFVYRFYVGERMGVYDKTGLLDRSGDQNIFEFTFQEWKERGFDIEELQEKKKICIAEELESKLSYYSSAHNAIAQQYGITYHFSLPAVDNSDFVRAMDDVGFFAFFQGYPLGDGTDFVYDQYSFSRAGLTEREGFLVVRKGEILIYHRVGCVKQQDRTDEELQFFNHVEECVMAGAFACEQCELMGIKLNR